MKYTTKKLISMDIDEIESICRERCGTNHCLFKESLHKYRFDGFCLKDTIEIAKKDINSLKIEINKAKRSINYCEEEIKFDEERIKAFQKELLENEK